MWMCPCGILRPRTCTHTHTSPWHLLDDRQERPIHTETCIHPHTHPDAVHDDDGEQGLDQHPHQVAPLPAPQLVDEGADHLGTKRDGEIEGATDALMST